MYSSSDSSSSESGDEDILINIILPEALNTAQRNKMYVENIVPNYSYQEFKEQFRVPREVVDLLSRQFEESIHFPTLDKGYQRISANKCILIFCWYAGHEAASFRDVADRCNISISTLHTVIERVTYFLSSLSADIIKWPTGDDALEIENFFREKVFPGVIGCLDGTHIRVDKPKEDPDSYINRNKYYSIQMQVVCDHRRQITDILIGYPGSVHDSRVFRTSPLYSTLEYKCGDKVILADSAYPCLTNVMTPYRDTGHLNDIERNFNYQLSRCRILIEHTFGILKQRFRQLYHLKLRNIETMCHFIRSCCLLHNLCIQHEANAPFDDIIGDIQVNEINNIGANDENLVNEAGHYKRNYLAALLYHQ